MDSTSYIRTAIYDVLSISYSYLHDDTDTVTFVLIVVLTTVVPAMWEDPSEPVGIQTNVLIPLVPRLDSSDQHLSR